MDLNPIRKALLKNKYLIVKRSLRLTGQSFNEMEYENFDEDSSLDTIESRLKSAATIFTNGHGSWLKHLFKW